MASTYSTASSVSKLSKHTLNKAIDLISVDYIEVELRVAVFYGIHSAILLNSWHKFRSMTISFKPKLNLRRTKKQIMTKKEIEIQKALGTLSYKEWMKIKGIIFDDTIPCKNNLSVKSWWYFPILEEHHCRAVHSIVTINDTEYYPVADGYIDDLYHSMAWRKWSEEKFADEIISQCYSCMSLQDIDH